MELDTGRIILRFAFEMELKQSICYLKTTLAGKHVHTVSCYSNWEITTGRWTIPQLFNFFPLLDVTL